MQPVVRGGAWGRARKPREGVAEGGVHPGASRSSLATVAPWRPTGAHPKQRDRVGMGKEACGGQISSGILDVSMSYLLNCRTPILVHTTQNRTQPRSWPGATTPVTARPLPPAARHRAAHVQMFSSNKYHSLQARTPSRARRRLAPCPVRAVAPRPAPDARAPSPRRVCAVAPPRRTRDPHMRPSRPAARQLTLRVPSRCTHTRPRRWPQPLAR